MAERMHYRNEVGDGPSEMIWGDPDLVNACQHPALGRHWYDDFMTFGPVAQSQANVRAGAYRVFTNGTTTIVGASAANGGIVLTNNSTSDNGSAIGGATWPINIPGAAAGAVPTGKKMALEMRVKFSTVTATVAPSCFIGLMDNTALSATVPVAAGATVGNCQCVGFFKGETAGSTIGLYYNDDNSPTAIQASALTSAAGENNQGDTLPAVAADTFLKLGVKYDPRVTDANGDNLSFFVNGILLQAGLTNVEIAALTNLAADYLTFVAGQINSASASAPTMTIDWVKMAHLL